MRACFSLDVLLKKHTSVFSVSAKEKAPLLWRRHHFHGSTRILSHTRAFTHQWRPPARCLRLFCCDLFWSQRMSLHDTAHFSLITSSPPKPLSILFCFSHFSLMFFHWSQTSWLDSNNRFYQTLPICCQWLLRCSQSWYNLISLSFFLLGAPLFSLECFSPSLLWSTGIPFYLYLSHSPCLTIFPSDGSFSLSPFHSVI